MANDQKHLLVIARSARLRPTFFVYDPTGLHNPTELARLVVGEPPGATVKLCLRHWGIVILSSRVGLGEKPLRESCSPVVRHRVARAGQGDDDLVVQHFDVKFVIDGHV